MHGAELVPLVVEEIALTGQALDGRFPLVGLCMKLRCWIAQVAGILGGDPVLIGQALDGDVIVEPARGPLIPGFAEVKAAARAAGDS